METLSPENIQPAAPTKSFLVPRWSRWIDEKLRVFVVIYKTGGYDAAGLWFVGAVGLLNLDTGEQTEVSMDDFLKYVEGKKLTRFTGTITV